MEAAPLFARLYRRKAKKTFFAVQAFFLWQALFLSQNKGKETCSPVIRFLLQIPFLCTKCTVQKIEA